MRPVYTFSSVEEFWSLYNNIHRPSKLAVGADFHCFKHKIEPKWEDPVCANGGKWTVSFSRGKSDTGWLYTLLAMIGEQFDHGDEICGAVVNVRARQENIALWTKDASNEAAQISHYKTHPPSPPFPPLPPFSRLTRLGRNQKIIVAFVLVVLLRRRPFFVVLPSTASTFTSLFTPPFVALHGRYHHGRVPALHRR
ncbi:hypothetical protein RHMOL_Rhmol01G0302600 [Rhododendron molle]|uniref:Uncharacterized protein n=1 Tax=Rhododendron molle TaxID=49168 RepID=A0ACC0Q709_RHOML|nr:hypothetical protein RHMOL_Rhmol01G0302600 [Rhododendron molle]